MMSDEIRKKTSKTIRCLEISNKDKILAEKLFLY